MATMVTMAASTLGAAREMIMGQNSQQETQWAPVSTGAARRSSSRKLCTHLQSAGNSFLSLPEQRFADGTLRSYGLGGWCM